MNSKIIGYRPEIDGLRALAVVAVVLNHLKISALPGGFVGVDVFFVISGYLISLILFKENELGYFSIFSFYQRRIKRLFPALLLVLISTLLFGWIALLANEYKMLAGHIKSSVVFLLNFKLMHEIGYFDVATLLKPVLHLWSLSVEEQFYFLWPVALIVATKLRLNIFFFVLLLTVSSMIFCCYLVRVNIDAAYYHPAARFWELLSGVLLAWNHYQNRLIGNHSSTASFNTNLVGMLGLSLICLSMVLIKKDTPYLNIMLLAPNIGAILVLNSNGNSMVVRVLSTPVFVWIGLISYPLYLWHWPIFSYIRIMEFGESNLLLLMGGGGVALILSILTYLYIEKPIRNSSKSIRWTVILLILMGCVFYSVTYIGKHEGVPSRKALEYLSPYKIQMQREPSQDKSCIDLFPNGDAPAYCLQNFPNKKMIALIGDSHAHVLFPGLSALAQSNGYGTILLANSGCPPLEGVLWGRNKSEELDCVSKVNSILSAIETDKRIMTVIIATRGPKYITGKGFGSIDNNYNYPPISSKSINELVPEDMFLEGLRATVFRLKKMSGLKSIRYVLQVPELGTSSENCLGRPLTISHKHQGCDIPYAVYSERMGSYRNKVIAESDNFFKVIDLEALFCNGYSCNGLVGKKLMYADDNHLSVDGSEYVAPTIFNNLNLFSQSVTH